MKNKKNIYILLPVVLFIWGAVMYQFFSFANTKETQQLTSTEFQIKTLTITERDTFSINVNYRDPFLGKMFAPQNNVTSKKTSKTRKEPQIEEPLIWPPILYKGIVSDTKDKIKIYMLIIGGKTCLMKKGETENEVFLKEGDRESVYVKYKGNLNLIMLAE
ncbi:hypothetical protein SAMN04488062_1316 [Flavobacterium omnivorum]|uniref:Uncharacterized protein n=1 Tax=Flavobacterium omnivorum TaxID=178355 RepID=A0A1G8J2W0_9FLAO|nr:hypothetical protein [Flavobacterium omnivorum]SDI25000.1 hypothetical protein SAMN04488062_1316 [Flavobacterium omnivorum]